MQQRSPAGLKLETLQFMVGILIPKPHQVLFAAETGKYIYVVTSKYHSATAQQ